MTITGAPDGAPRMVIGLGSAPYSFLQALFKL